MTTVLLAGAAVVLGGAFGLMAWMGDLHEHARLFVALFSAASLAYGVAAVRVVRRPPGRRALVGILAAAAVFRLLLLPTTPSLSTDVYRYLWDGRLSAAGVSPYRDPPNAPSLARLRDEAVYPHLNHLDWRTVYPPGAQLLFGGLARLAPGRVLAFKLLVVAGDVLTLALLCGWLRVLGRPLSWALLYAWHPLVVVELAGTGHLDSLALAASVGALWAATRGREGWAGALVGVGGLVKLYPLLLLPAVWCRHPRRALGACGATLAAGYAVYVLPDWGQSAAVLGSLGRYLAEEEFNGGLRPLLQWMLGGGDTARLLGRLLPLAGLARLAGAIGLRGRALPPWQRALWLVGGYLVAIPNLFPWYTLWIVPILAVAPAWPWLYLSGAVALSYLVFAEPLWRIPLWVWVAEFGPLGVGLALWVWPGGAWGRWPEHLAPGASELSA